MQWSNDEHRHTRIGDPYSGGLLSAAHRGEQNATVDALPAGITGHFGSAVATSLGTRGRDW